MIASETVKRSVPSAKSPRSGVKMTSWYLILRLGLIAISCQRTACSEKGYYLGCFQHQDNQDQQLYPSDNTGTNGRLNSPKWYISGVPFITVSIPYSNHIGVVDIV